MALHRLHLLIGDTIRRITEGSQGVIALIKPLARINAMTPGKTETVLSPRLLGTVSEQNQSS